MEGRQIANLLIYSVYFVLNLGERPKRENFSYMQLRKDCQFTFKSHQIMKKELLHNPAELDKEVKRKLDNINWPITDELEGGEFFRILDIFKTHYYFNRIPVTYYRTKPDLPGNPRDLDKLITCKGKFPITDSQEMANLEKYKSELRRYYMLDRRLLQSYIQIADERKPLPNDYKEIRGECANYLLWKYTVINNFTYGVRHSKKEFRENYLISGKIEKLRKEYIFSGLPATYFYQPSNLPLNTNVVTMPNHIKLPIRDKKDIRILIDVPEAGVQLPINRADLKYEGKEVLSSVDTVITEMVKKTEEVMVLPITDRVKVSNIIKLLHKFYNFKYLPSEFFHIPAIANPVFSIPVTQIQNPNAKIPNAKSQFQMPNPNYF
ncbi:hypothetical protein Glove_83g68 [Diversispora epigaea]|uniref:Uncharacterized protein n=1 Tax=Diversispora epigaea TaxID=1348612 RepID=A0A397JHB6_9GLOM|nr:hypothetical protein Glove_83g68 [Diversispora epigaea]